MNNVGKATDGLLDALSEYKRNRENTRQWLELYQEANLISPDVAAHLWEVLMGLNETAEEQADAESDVR